MAIVCSVSWAECTLQIDQMRCMMSMSRTAIERFHSTLKAIHSVFVSICPTTCPTTWVVPVWSRIGYKRMAKSRVRVQEWATTDATNVSAAKCAVCENTGATLLESHSNFVGQCAPPTHPTRTQCAAHQWQRQQIFRIGTRSREVCECPNCVEGTGCVSLQRRFGCGWVRFVASRARRPLPIAPATSRRTK